MVWQTSHGARERSYSSHEELGRQLAKVTSAPQWAVLAPLFTRPGGSPFPVTPADAGAMATVFEDVEPLMPQDWRFACRDLAAAARRACADRQTWEWF
jgi:hypothetical protein